MSRFGWIGDASPKGARRAGGAVVFGEFGQPLPAAVLTMNSALPSSPAR